MRAVKAPVLQYAVVMLLLLTVHLGVGDIFKTGQRYELFLLPLIVGAFAAISDQHLVVLRAYVLAATALAIVWPFAQSIGQKNPVGQMIGNAILVLIAIPSLRKLFPCLLILVPGLLYTESRGAIGATIVGVVVIGIFTGHAARLVRRRIVLLAALAVVVFMLMPSSLRTRVTTLSAGTNTPAAYDLKIRQQFSADARAIIARHPWVGVGVGNYQNADANSKLPSNDPHEVLLLQAAEGGYGLAVSFVLLVLGSAVALFTKMRGIPLAAAAAAVLLATAVARPRRRLLGARNSAPRLAARRNGLRRVRAAAARGGARRSLRPSTSSLSPTAMRMLWTPHSTTGGPRPGDGRGQLQLRQDVAAVAAASRRRLSRLGREPRLRAPA